MEFVTTQQDKEISVVPVDARSMMSGRPGLWVLLSNITQGQVGSRAYGMTGRLA